MNILERAREIRQEVGVLSQEMNRLQRAWHMGYTNTEQLSDNYYSGNIIDLTKHRDYTSHFKGER